MTRFESLGRKAKQIGRPFTKLFASGQLKGNASSEMELRITCKRCDGMKDCFRASSHLTRTFARPAYSRLSLLAFSIAQTI
jgi:hypothetical protein